MNNETRELPEQCLALSRLPIVGLVSAELAKDIEAALAKPDQKNTESVLINGAAYDIPIEVAVELLDLYITVKLLNKNQKPVQEPDTRKLGAIIEVFENHHRLEYLSLPVGKHKLYPVQYVHTSRKPMSQEQAIDLLPTNTSMSRTDALLWVLRATERFHDIGAKS
jgi:hypothetical protein